MFTGIIESQAQVLLIKAELHNVHLKFSSTITPELNVNQSLSHNGVCLTVTQIEEDGYWVTAINETLACTQLGSLIVGDYVNIERCLLLNGRFDGHVVQGHVDCKGLVETISEQGGSWILRILHPRDAGMTVKKGSVCLNGISLTVVDSFLDAFSVAIIPYTWENSNVSSLRTGDPVNIEFDIYGKYIQKMMGHE